MEELKFKKSELGSIGVEVELQIINNESYKLASAAIEILDHFHKTPYKSHINHEITQGMIEINTSPHLSPEKAFEELVEIQTELLAFSKGKGYSFCGGGTHPFQNWHEQKIFPDERYKKISERYQYLCQEATIFGQHVHFGCSDTEQAIYLTHAFSQFAPHLIALSSSSPFYEGIDTGFYSSRSTHFNAFPVCGHMPFLRDWDAFINYFFHMKDLGIIESMKDVYWDVRPKPEFGTVEVRILDTPLTLRRAAAIAAFIQSLGLYLLAERPITPKEEMYYLYGSNRFQGCRYGLEGLCAEIDPYKNYRIQDRLLHLFGLIRPYAKQRGGDKLLSELERTVQDAQSDSMLLRERYKKNKSLEDVVAEQCKFWMSTTGDR